MRERARHLGDAACGAAEPAENLRALCAEGVWNGDTQGRIAHAQAHHLDGTEERDRGTALRRRAELIETIGQTPPRYRCANAIGQVERYPYAIVFGEPR